MKHYVLGFLFTSNCDKVLLVKKNKPKWMKDRWNGIGGKVEEKETPMEAMKRETLEEVGMHYVWEQRGTFIHPGGTVFVFASVVEGSSISYRQLEEEELRGFFLDELPKTVMKNLKYLIPLCLSTVKDFMLNQVSYGTGDTTVDG
ncbi:MAG: NUDIX hydrolase [Planctomycetes bacterium]|nr:NUDIX hydrolase [Planctomycetota bacterium]